MEGITDLLLILAGGLIGILGSRLSHMSSKKETRRQELISAYSEWGASIYNALREWSDFELCGFIERTKKEEPDLSDIAPSPTGRSRQARASDTLRAMNKLDVSCSKLLLLEDDESFATRVIELSEVLSQNIKTDSLEFLKFFSQRENEVSAFMREIRKTHKLLR